MPLRPPRSMFRLEDQREGADLVSEIRLEDYRVEAPCEVPKTPGDVSNHETMEILSKQGGSDE